MLLTCLCFDRKIRDKLEKEKLDAEQAERQITEKYNSIKVGVPTFNGNRNHIIVMLILRPTKLLHNRPIPIAPSVISCVVYCG